MPAVPNKIATIYDKVGSSRMSDRAIFVIKCTTDVFDFRQKICLLKNDAAMRQLKNEIK